MTHKLKYNQGMTYTELIVVLGIFTTMSSVIIYNYGKFQDRLNIKSLSSDIAIKIVEAQKSALAGVVEFLTFTGGKPAYGVYFNTAVNNKNFIYFADLDNNTIFASTSCSVSECIENFVIGKGNYISNISVTGQGGCVDINTLHIVFTRPDASAKMTTNQPSCTNISEAQITIMSPKGDSALIKVYQLGRIQVI